MNKIQIFGPPFSSYVWVARMVCRRSTFHMTSWRGYYVQRFPEGGEMVQSTKSLSAYFAHHSERRSYKASFPPPLPGVRTVRASEVAQ
jgi:hypothetical protein